MKWSYKRPKQEGFYYLGQNGEVHHQENDLIKIESNGDGTFIVIAIPGRTYLHDYVVPLEHMMFDEFFWCGPVQVEPAPHFDYCDAHRYDGEADLYGCETEKNDAR